jgi:hypothetical protein
MTPIPTNTATPTDTPEPADILPILECVNNNGGGSYTALFGYDNPNGFPVNIPINAQNGFTPPPQDRGQPTAFAPGRQFFVFSVDFSGSPPITWHLDSSTAQANDGSPACSLLHSGHDSPTGEATSSQPTSTPSTRLPLPPLWLQITWTAALWLVYLRRHKTTTFHPRVRPN